MQRHLEKIDALIAEMRAETVAIEELVNVKEQAVVAARRSTGALGVHLTAMEKLMPRLRESCDALKDV